ncbi:hypothetical protein IHE44_0014071 [Lamprotornis superbus]|uniref:Galanin peptides n=1 Tax=Lamprotornis superbus TaxID=245042 RepID=A0A835NPN1_9PASS|nr:hypothetical protein IHE44_0014071 [Lamprotornis superbus]
MQRKRLSCKPNKAIERSSAVCYGGYQAKDKRGWTLNSAGYLLGPHAVDNHRSFNDKHGFTGKREIPPDEDIKAGSLGRPVADENIVRTIMEFLTYLHLKANPTS